MKSFPLAAPALSSPSGRPRRSAYAGLVLLLALPACSDPEPEFFDLPADPIPCEFQYRDVCLHLSYAVARRFSESITIDTSLDDDCARPPLVAEGSPYCIVAGTTLEIPADVTVRAIGTRPLVLLASQTITIDGTLDVSSSREVVIPPQAAEAIGAGGGTYKGCQSFRRAATHAARAVGGDGAVDRDPGLGGHVDRAAGWSTAASSGAQRCAGAVLAAAAGAQQGGRGLGVKRRESAQISRGDVLVVAVAARAAERRERAARARAATVVERRHYAGDASLSLAQARTRWAQPLQSESWLVEISGHLVDTVWVQEGAQWRVLLGLDQAALAVLTAAAPACGAAALHAGAPGPCSDAVWSALDGALRGRAELVERACARAQAQCQ